MLLRAVVGNKKWALKAKTPIYFYSKMVSSLINKELEVAYSKKRTDSKICTIRRSNNSKSTKTRSKLTPEFPFVHSWFIAIRNSTRYAMTSSGCKSLRSKKLINNIKLNTTNAFHKLISLLWILKGNQPDKKVLSMNLKFHIRSQFIKLFRLMTFKHSKTHNSSINKSSPKNH